MREAVVLHLQRGLVEALAVADLAGHVDVGQEVHLHALHAVALAGLAAAALHVEGEAARRVAVHARLGQQREEVADRVEELGVGRGVAARRAADRALVDVDDLVDLARGPSTCVVRADRHVAAVQRARHRRVEDLVDERALARAATRRSRRRTGPAGTSTSTSLRLFSRAPDHGDLAAVAARAAARAARSRSVARAGSAPVRLSGSAHHLGGRARGHDLAAVPAGARGRSRRASRTPPWPRGRARPPPRVLPMSRRCLSAASSLRLSRWCRPIDGSSST